MNRLGVIMMFSPFLSCGCSEHDRPRKIDHVFEFYTYGFGDDALESLEERFHARLGMTVLLHPIDHEVPEIMEDDRNATKKQTWWRLARLYPGILINVGPVARGMPDMPWMENSGPAFANNDRQYGVVVTRALMDQALEADIGFEENFTSAAMHEALHLLLIDEPHFDDNQHCQEVWCIMSGKFATRQQWVETMERPTLRMLCHESLVRFTENSHADGVRSTTSPDVRGARRPKQRGPEGCCGPLRGPRPGR